MRKRFLLCLFVLMTLFSMAASASDDYPTDLPYESYVYNSQNNPVETPVPYAPEQVFTGQNFDVGSFKDLEDGFFDGKDRIYLCDAGNNRIVVLDTSFRKVGVLSAFSFGGKADSLSGPNGVFANESRIYVADSQNSRLVEFDRKNLQPVAILPRPEVSLLGNQYKYTPNKLAVDHAGRIYVLAAGINQGLMCLDEDGKFTSFLGAPQVKPNFFETIWKKISTKAQRKQMESYVPTEYDSVIMDQNGFLYVTSETSSTVPVGKLNSNGKNVLTKLRDGAEYGDLAYLGKQDQTGSTYFADIAVQPDGSYFVLDSKQGKIYAYTADGRMLYAFGANGSQKGTYYTASSLEIVHGDLIVTDSTKQTVTVLGKTQFGRNVQTALSLYDQGAYQQSAVYWNKVRKQCSSYPLASVGLAKIEMQNGHYTHAMSLLLPVLEHDDYAQAFAKWRDAFIKQNFFWIFIGVFALITLLVLLKAISKKKSVAQRISKFDLWKKIRYGTYVMFHPFDGFWDLKHEQRGSLPAALCLYLSFLILFALRTQFSGYVVTGVASENVNVLYSAAVLVIPFCFWIISNWCFTTLMDGKGTMRDIVVAGGYSLMPYVVCSLPLLLLSHMLTAQESVFYLYADKACVVWVFLLLFFGMMTTHEYSLSKAILTLALTLVGVCVILFILLLLVNILQQVFVYGYNIYKELSFRTY